VTNAPEQFTVEANVNMLDQAVEEGYDAICTIPVSIDAYAPVFEKAKAKGIPVVCFHADALGTVRDAYVGPDPVAYAGLAARTLAKWIGEEGEVAISYYGQTDSHKIIRDEFARVLAAEFPKVKIVYEETEAMDVAKGMQKLTSMFQAYPNIKGFFQTYGNAADIVGVTTDLGIKEKVKILSMDTTTTQLKFVADGKIDGVVSQSLWDSGYNAIVIAKDILDNGGILPDKWKEINVAPSEIVTKENMAKYEEFNAMVKDIIDAARK